MLGWRHRLDGHEFERSLGVCDGQGSLACCGPWGCKASDRNERLNCTDSSALATTMDGELVSAEETQAGRNTCCPPAIRLWPVPTESPEETQGSKTQDTGPT